MDIGTISSGWKLGRGNKGKVIWSACVDCGKERWVELVQGAPRVLRCRVCANKANGKTKVGKYRGELCCNWRGGRAISRGYVEVRIQPDDFFYPMATKGGSVPEHRLIMAKHLGRCLHSWEMVHHKNHIKMDNRIENLQLVMEGQHNQITLMENRIRQLEQRVTLLEAESVLLKQDIVAEYLTALK